MPRFVSRASIVALVLCRIAAAQISPVAKPVFHGVMGIQPATGRIDRHTGDARLKVTRWRFLPTPDSNGIFPDAEPIIVAVGDNTFSLPAGSLEALRRGKVFRYRAPGGPPLHGIDTLRLVRRHDGSFRVAFTLTGVAVPRLLFETPVCVPTAVIVGDDDAASGINLNSRNFTTRRIAVQAKPCNAGWPWLNQ